MPVARIAVGSQNPVKLNAALLGFQTMFPDGLFSVQGYSVDSGVSDQPMSCDETLLGARNRCQTLLESAKAEYFVGIEGGIERIDNTLFANAWIVIMDSERFEAVGRSGSFQLPPEVQELIEGGMELGHANDKVFQEHNSKHAGGAVGSLTGGVIDREGLYVHAMSLALIAFRKPEMFRATRQ